MVQVADEEGFNSRAKRRLWETHWLWLKPSELREAPPHAFLTRLTLLCAPFSHRLNFFALSPWCPPLRIRPFNFWSCKRYSLLYRTRHVCPLALTLSASSDILLLGIPILYEAQALANPSDEYFVIRYHSSYTYIHSFYSQGARTFPRSASPRRPTSPFRTDNHT